MKAKLRLYQVEVFVKDKPQIVRPVHSFSFENELRQKARVLRVKIEGRVFASSKPVTSEEGGIWVRFGVTRKRDHDRLVKIIVAIWPESEGNYYRIFLTPWGYPLSDTIELKLNSEVES